MEWLGSAERGKLKGKNYPLLLGDLSCWFERRQSSKGCCGQSCCLLCLVFSAAVSVVEHQDHCRNLLLPEITAWELPHGSLGCILHKLWLQGAFRISSSGCYCCRGTGSWACGTEESNAVGSVQDSCKRSPAGRAGYLLEEWAVLCTWLPSQILPAAIQECVLKWVEINTAIYNTDQSRWNQWTLMEKTVSARKEICCSTWCSLVPLFLSFNNHGKVSFILLLVSTGRQSEVFAHSLKYSKSQ